MKTWKALLKRARAAPVVGRIVRAIAGRDGRKATGADAEVRSLVARSRKSRLSKAQAGRLLEHIREEQQEDPNFVFKLQRVMQSKPNFPSVGELRLFHYRRHGFDVILKYCENDELWGENAHGLDWNEYREIHRNFKRWLAEQPGRTYAWVPLRAYGNVGKILVMERVEGIESPRTTAYLEARGQLRDDVKRFSTLPQAAGKKVPQAYTHVMYVGCAKGIHYFVVPHDRE